MDLYYWNLFCKDYNIEHLNNISFNGLEIIKSFINKNVKYKGLQRILKLYFYIDWKKSRLIKHIDILTDIISLSYYQLNKIKIYIFGEYHYPTDKCSISNNKMNVFDFIKLNIENIPKFIDIFTETAYITKEMKNTSSKVLKINSSPLVKFENEFKQCLSQQSEINKCLNIRFHNTDIRLPITKRLPFIPYIHNLMFHMDQEINKNNFPFSPSARENSNNFIKYLNAYNKALLDPKNSEEISNYTNAKSLPSLLKMYINLYNDVLNGKFNKQLLKVNPHIRDVLEKYMNEKFNELDFYYINFNNIRKFMNTLSITIFPTKFQAKELNKYTKYNILAESIFMDVYLMARVFRTFDKKEYQYSESPKNIIIYVGYKHSENYREILHKLKFKELFKTKAKYGEFCIDISKLKQPLFT